MARRKEERAKRSYQEILLAQIREGLHELKRPTLGLFVSALAAGLEVSFSVLLMATLLNVVTGVVAEPVSKVLVALMYSLGFIFVILGRSELFTEHTTLAVLPVLNARASMDSLVRLWTVVWLGNVIGATVFSMITAFIGPQLGIFGAAELFQIGGKLVAHSWWVIIVSGVLAGWLMGLLSWLVAASRDTTAQILLVTLVTFSIGLAGLHHSIVGTAEVLSAMFSGAPVTWIQFFRFLLATTVGNAIGGAFFVAFMKYRHATASSRKQLFGNLIQD